MVPVRGPAARRRLLEAAAPEPPPLGARLTFEGAKPFRIAHVRRDGVGRGIPGTHDLGVEEGALVEPDVGEKPSVAITFLGIQLERDRSSEQAPAREFRGEASEGLDRRLRPMVAARRPVEPVRLVLLRRVDSDQAHGRRTTRQLHPDRVPVDDVENGRVE